jgi:hypothetical protein
VPHDPSVRTGPLLIRLAINACMVFSHLLSISRRGCDPFHNEAMCSNIT